MKKLFVCAIFYVAGAFITAPAHANSLTLVNHYGNTLKFHIEAGEDQEVGLSSNFSLNDYVSAFAYKVNPAVYECEPENSPIQISFYDSNSNQKVPNDGYFGAGLGCGSQQNKVIVRSYIGRKIAYSINNNYSENPVITFCTPTEYTQHGNTCPG